MNKIFAVMGLALVLQTTDAQTVSTSLKHFQQYCEIVLRDGGKWKSGNKDYIPGDSTSANYFGYEFTKGINANTIHQKILNYYPLKAEWIVTLDATITWNPQKQKVIYQANGENGSLWAGESEKILANEIDFILNITSSDGKLTKHRMSHQFSKDTLLGRGYWQNQTRWQEMTPYYWTRLEQATGNLAFLSTRDGNFEVYSMNAKGDNLRNLTCNMSTDYAFGYTPDRKLVFYSYRDGNSDIYMQWPDGKRIVNLTKNPASDRVTAISPDGKWIAFTSDRDHKSSEIYLMDTTGANVKRLTFNENFEDVACWSVDGKKILFSRDIVPVSDTVSKSNGEIFIMDIDGSNVKRLTDRPGFDGGAQFSPDGKQIAFYGKSEKGYYEIFVMDADGNNIRNITEDAMEDYSPSWSPDGKWIAYTRGNSSNYDVWLIHLETKIKTRLTTHPRRDESPFWEPVKK